MKIISQKNAITFAQGFFAAGIHAGIKKKKKDFGLIFSQTPAVSGTCFTKNRIKAWPLQYCEQIAKNANHQAILFNSGNANCFNGPRGKKLVEQSVAFTAKALSVQKSEVFVASTGVIGRELDQNNLLCSIPELVMSLSTKKGSDAALASLTTDTKPKEMVTSFRVGKKTIRLGGFAKGAGMISPNMATMFAFVTTDLAISKRMLQSAVGAAVEKTFNCISIDNDMSTNDFVCVLANGEAGNQKVVKKDKTYHVFEKGLTLLFQGLAKKMLQDGEGVYRICQINILGAKTQKEAKIAAASIAHSMLFKTALTGGDPNWGRIIAAVGAALDVHCQFDQMDLSFGKVKIIRNGKLANYSLKKAEKEFSKREVVISLNLKAGHQKTTFTTTDLTKKYVHINSEYTT